MNAAQFRERIRLVAAFAAKEAPTDANARARIFVAGLSGRIQHDEPALAAILWSVVDRSSEGKGDKPSSAGA